MSLWMWNLLIRAVKKSPACLGYITVYYIQYAIILILASTECRCMGAYSPAWKIPIDQPVQWNGIEVFCVSHATQDDASFGVTHTRSP